jgi:tetratricopeptide (TPR) repeat protein
MSRPSSTGAWASLTTFAVVAATLALSWTSARASVPSLPGGSVDDQAVTTATTKASPTTTTPQATSSSGSTIAPTTTTLPTAVQRATDSLNRLSNLLLAFLKLVGIVIGLGLAVYAAERLRQLQHRRQLVVADVTNASGLDQLDSQLPGLSQLAREQLLKDMQALKDYELGGRFPPPQRAPDQAFENLIGAVKEALPQEAGAVVQFLRVVALEPNVTQVTLGLQRLGEVSARHGITVEIADLARKEVPAPTTLWEPRPASGGGAPPLPTRPAEPMAGPRWGTQRLTGLGRKLLARLRGHQPVAEDDVTIGHLRLGKMYAARRAFEPAKAAYEAALKQQPDHQGAREALQELLDAGDSAGERYVAQLHPVSRFVVLELFTRDMIST